MPGLPITRTSARRLAALLSLALPVQAQLQFDDMAPLTGTSNPSYGRGSAMVDLDGDGLQDLIASNAGMDNAFFRQLSDHTFEHVNQAWGILPDARYSWGVLVADFDNDGDPDVYFINGGFLGTNHPNQYLRNDLDSLGVFTDVPAGAATEPSTSFGGTAFDYDRDGDLDLFVTTTWVEDGACILLENDGNGVFTDVSVAAGITHVGHFRHCTMGDIDNDGWFDIAVGGWFHNRVYRNNGDGTFAEVAEQVGLAFTNQNANFGLVLEDFDNDGWTDAYVPRYQLGGATGPSQILINDGSGVFIDVTAGSGMPGQADMGHSSGDLDADGFPDIYIGTGGPAEGQPDVMLTVTPNGAGGLTAVDVSVSSGILSKGPTRCHGMAFGDYDGDGFVDVYVNNGGPDWATASTLEENFLWKNQGNANNWTALSLTGVRSNKSAVGALAVAVADSGDRVCRLRRAGHGFANSDSPILHFGMGANQAVDRIEIQWPSGIEQVLLAPANKQITDVIETGTRLVGEPEPGSQVTLELAGPAGFEAAIFTSLSTADIPLPELGGIVRLAPPAQLFASLSLDSEGKGALALAIPESPPPIGATVHFQAWVHPASGLSGSVLSNLVTLSVQP